MDSIEKQNTYSTTNTYSTLNTIGSQTENIWVVFHGLGFLSRYFIKFFDELSGEANYIIAPQAPSKFYLNGQFKHVGASWLTKEKTELETENVLNYVDSVLESEDLPADKNLIVFGFSQGVSIAARWAAKRKINCAQLVLYAGDIPKELQKKDFDFLQENKTKVTTIVGDNDEYLTPERMDAENKKIDLLFQGKAIKIVFNGGHEIRKEILKNLIS